MALGDADKLYNTLSTVFPDAANDGDVVQFPVQITINKVNYSKTVNMKYKTSRKNGQTQWVKSS